jgi:metal-sulfur cluster biosynthetic enzyme
METLNANPLIYGSTAAARRLGDEVQGSETPLHEQPALISTAQLPFLSSAIVLPVIANPQDGGISAAQSSVSSPAAFECSLWSAAEVFDLLRDINDPEHPLTLEQLQVAQLQLIDVSDSESTVAVRFTPTIPHCSMATLIGLCIRVQLLRALPSRFKVDIRITPGSHATEQAINKQLNDKERVAAALENSSLQDIVNRCIAPH